MELLVEEGEGGLAFFKLLGGDALEGVANCFEFILEIGHDVFLLGKVFEAVNNVGANVL